MLLLIIRDVELCITSLKSRKTSSFNSIIYKNAEKSKQLTDKKVWTIVDFSGDKLGDKEWKCK